MSSPPSANEGGLDNVAFSYQWQADDSNISGATGETYTLADADEGKAIGVTVSFTDDAGNAETLTSAATDAVDGAPSTPLTVSVENVAASHDGERVFTFELRFSEEFGISYKTLRDHAFTVTGGTVKKAQRLEQGSNIGWRITAKNWGQAPCWARWSISRVRLAQSKQWKACGLPVDPDGIL